jgi:calcium-binding protein CML
MTDQLSDKQIDELKEAFGIFDKSTGMINVKDLPILLKSIGHNPSEEETKALIAQVRDNFVI